MIQTTLEKIRDTLVERFGTRLKCVLLYGSWATGTARKDSDIDLLAVLQERALGDGKAIADLFLVDNREISLVTCTEDEFRRENIPLHTAVKREGKILWGNIDRNLNPEPPEVKYADFFRKSQEFESRKLEMAKKLLEDDYLSGIPEVCFVAAKHALQAALAMKGEGYSSKVAVLLPLVRAHFGPEVAEEFQKLSEMYSRTDFSLESVPRKEAKEAIHLAEKVFEKVFRFLPDKNSFSRQI
ncbi:MAG: nucleotidyltransferase domain-containing protein [Syntrophaceae bacterium]|nr:nucleotidyltransferase domain-containing protein [Syntrophaceae bacterium]